MGHWWVRPLGWFALSRLIVVAATWAATVTATRPLTIGSALGAWDGEFYRQLATDGYPGGAEWPAFRTALFPLYPLLTRGADGPVPGGVHAAAMVVSCVAAIAFVLLAWKLAAGRFGPETADTTVAVIVCFPGTYVLSMHYAEAVFLAASAACLLLLDHKRWLGAGLAAMACTAARPNGIAAVAACAVAAVPYLRARQWRSLVAPALAPLGLVGFVVFLQSRSGRWDAWPHVQSEVWDDRIDLSANLDRLHVLFTGATREPTEAFAGAGVLVVAALGAALWRRRLLCPPHWWAWSIVAVLPSFLSSLVGPRPRLLLGLFPVAAVLAHETSRVRTSAVIAASAAALAVVSLLNAAAWADVPRVGFLP